MQWILQEFEDARALAEALERLGLPHSWHRVVPFAGDLIPEPEIADPARVLLFGSYGLWRYAERRGLRPGVFRIRPFSEETPWQPHLLNAGARVMTVREVPEALAGEEGAWFVRPLGDGKEIAGRVMEAPGIVALAEGVLRLGEDEVIGGALGHDTALMLSPPASILKEWRLWVVGDRIVTWSLYREGARVVYRRELDDDARAFAEALLVLNPGYAPAYVMDIARAEAGLRLLETNCINAAGLYAANPMRLATALEEMGLG